MGSWPRGAAFVPNAWKFPDLPSAFQIKKSKLNKFAFICYFHCSNSNYAPFIVFHVLLSETCGYSIFLEAVGMAERPTDWACEWVSERMFKGIGSINEHCFGRLTK